MVGPLIQLHLVQQAREDWTIDPPNIPIFFFIGAQSEIGLTSSVFQHLVLSIANVYYQALFFWSFALIIFLSYQLSTCIIGVLNIKKCSIFTRLNILGSLCFIWFRVYRVLVPWQRLTLHGISLPAQWWQHNSSSIACVGLNVLKINISPLLLGRLHPFQRLAPFARALRFTAMTISRLSTSFLQPLGAHLALQARFRLLAASLLLHLLCALHLHLLLLLSLELLFRLLHLMSELLK